VTPGYQERRNHKGNEVQRLIRQKCTAVVGKSFSRNHLSFHPVDQEMKKEIADDDGLAPDRQKADLSKEYEAGPGQHIMRGSMKEQRNKTLPFISDYPLRLKGKVAQQMRKQQGHKGRGERLHKNVHFPEYVQKRTT
jgi:hypothetical protein